MRAVCFERFFLLFACCNLQSAKRQNGGQKLYVIRSKIQQKQQILAHGTRTGDTTAGSKFAAASTSAASSMFASFPIVWRPTIQSFLTHAKLCRRLLSEASPMPRSRPGAFVTRRWICWRERRLLESGGVALFAFIRQYLLFSLLFFKFVLTNNKTRSRFAPLISTQTLQITKNSTKKLVYAEQEIFSCFTGKVSCH